MIKENFDMANEKELLNDFQEIDEVEFDFDELEAKLQGQLEEELADLEFLREEREKIGNPEALGEIVQKTIFLQLDNYMAGYVGQEFIDDNHGMTLDLRKSAHIQTPENFEKGKLATHNFQSVETNDGSKYTMNKVIEKKYDEYMNNFRTEKDALTDAQKRILDGQEKDARYNKKTQTFERYDKSRGMWIGDSRYNEEKKVWEQYDRIDREWKKTLKDKSVRKPYDKGRDVGKNGMAKDHEIAAATIIRDPEAALYLTEEERVKFANSDANLHDLSSPANSSKGDHDGEKWIKEVRTGKNGNGETNAEYYGIDKEKYIEQNRDTKEKYKEIKEEPKKNIVESGKKSQKEEFYRISGTALKTAFLSLLTALVKEIIAKLVLWFKSADKNIKTFIEYVKIAIKSFASKLKSILTNTTESVLTTIATTIIGPVIGTIKKTVALLKQGWQSLKEAVQFIRKPENRGKPLSYLLPQVGIIVITGLTGIGAVALGEIIEKALSGTVLGVEIPLLGSPANLIGMLMGAIVCGIIGAIAINLINKFVEKKQKSEIVAEQIDKGNEALHLQHKIQTVNEAKLDHVVVATATSIKERHTEAANVMRNSLENIVANCKEDESIAETQDEIDNLFEELEGE